MSTKCTLAHGEKFHLYVDLFEPDIVCLRLTDADFLVQKSEVTVAIPLEVWDQIRAKAVKPDDYWDAKEQREE